MRGTRRRLTLMDMLPLPEYDEPLIWRERVFQARRRFKTTFKTLAYTLRSNLGVMIGYAIVTALTGFIAPFSLYQLLNYLQQPSGTDWTPWLWVALMFLGPMLRSASFQQYVFNSTRLVVRTKLCLVQELYAKAGRSYDLGAAFRSDDEEPDGPAITSFDMKAKKQKRSENVTNLMAYDVDAICNSRDIILVTTAIPIEMIIGLVFLYAIVGPCAFIAFAIMLCSFPMVSLLSQQMSRLQRKLMENTDSRVSVISEYLHSIRIIKYLAWEDVMAGRITAERRAEENLTWKRNLLAAAVVVVGDLMPLLALFAMFATYTLALGHPLTAAKAFTSLTIIETIRLKFTMVGSVTRFISQAIVAFARIDRYMMNEPEVIRHPEGAPAFQRATFQRGLDEDSFHLYLDATFVVGGLNVIAGPSGSGKSSVLLSLLGETVLVQGRATCPRDVAYASQIPWLLNDTIRANILLHEPFYEERYNEVIEACALLPDLEKLEKRDLTEVGTNGANLSGGQKQRLSLARAMYSRSSTLLLDDVFSALDSTTQKHIWDQCFHGRIVQDRTIILVTQMQAAKNEAARIVELSNGSILSTAEGPGLAFSNSASSSLPSDAQPVRDVQISSEDAFDSQKDDIMRIREAITQKITSETADQTRNPRTLFYQYMLLFGGHSRAVFTLGLCFLVQLLFFAIPLWLSVWVESYEKEDAMAVGFYVGIYGAGIAGFPLFCALSHTNIQLGAWKVARIMHQKLVSAVMSVSIHWYDKTPPGRVVNRFSRDIYSLDSVLVDFLRITLDNALRFALRLTAVGSIMPIFALPAVLICALGFACAEMYTRTQLSVKALSSAAQSPIFSFFEESLEGRTIIRARHGMPHAFADSLSQRLRLFARAAETQYNLNRWICVRADGCAAIIAFATGILALSMHSHTSSGLVGFSLTSAIGLGQTILNLVRNMNELEVELNCFHRVREYASLPPEEEATDLEHVERALPEDWPSHGQLEFRNVTARYEVDGPDILKDVSFTLSPGERVAIVGRTGSGKSTLALSLLNFVHITSGGIFIDGIDIRTIPVSTLRKRLTIIPQDPVLFGGDVSFNLDPSQASNPAQIAEALEACSVLESLGPVRGDSDSELGRSGTIPADKSLRVDTPVAPQGRNFSVGQRQVLSLARATVRRSKVVILDEATASVDHQSDALVQEVLASAFQQRTIIAIVHRLSTIINYDKIIVMESGMIREMGPPIELFRQKGAFSSMVLQSIQQGKGGEWSPEKLDQLDPDQATSSSQD